MTLFGNRVVAGVISSDEVTLEKCGPNPNKLMKRGLWDRHAHREAPCADEG